MGDRLMTDDDIDALCSCRGVTRDVAIEFQRFTRVSETAGAWTTVAYNHKDCPLHGVTRIKREPVPPFRMPE